MFYGDETYTALLAVLPVCKSGLINYIGEGWVNEALLFWRAGKRFKLIRAIARTLHLKQNFACIDLCR